MMHDMGDWHWGFGFGHWILGALIWAIIFFALVLLVKPLFKAKNAPKGDDK